MITAWGRGRANPGVCVGMSRLKANVLKQEVGGAPLRRWEVAGVAGALSLASGASASVAPACTDAERRTGNPRRGGNIGRELVDFLCLRTRKTHIARAYSLRHIGGWTRVRTMAVQPVAVDMAVVWLCGAQSLRWRWRWLRPAQRTEAGRGCGRRWLRRWLRRRCCLLMDCRCKDLLVFDLALNPQKFP